jgi:hypothetical protein
MTDCNNVLCTRAYAYANNSNRYNFPELLEFILSYSPTNACMHTQACMNEHTSMYTQASMHACMHTHANTHVFRRASYRFSKLLELLLCHSVSLPENEVRLLPLPHAYIQRFAFRYQKRQKNKKFPSTKKTDIQTMY